MVVVKNKRTNNSKPATFLFDKKEEWVDEEQQYLFEREDWMSGSYIKTKEKNTLISQNMVVTVTLNPNPSFKR